MKAKPPELEPDHIGSQDPALQPTSEDAAAISRAIRERKQQAIETSASRPTKTIRQQPA